MSVKDITTDELRTMIDRGGIIFQGCGGEAQEWIDGINGLLTEENILKDGARFKNVERFNNEYGTCFLFPFTEDVKLDMGKLAIWRIKTNDSFGGMWLSDYVNVHLGGFAESNGSTTTERKKPNCDLIGQDGNIFNLIGIASRTLRRAGLSQEAKEMSDRIIGGEAKNYHHALSIIGEYVNITSGEEQDEDLSDIAEESFGLSQHQS